MQCGTTQNDLETLFEGPLWGGNSRNMKVVCVCGRVIGGMLFEAQRD